MKTTPHQSVLLPVSPVPAVKAEWFSTRWAVLAAGVCLLAMAAAGSARATVTMNWATVGNPGNAHDTADGDVLTAGVQNFGMVNSTYRIATEEVTNAQYAEFLNAVDAGGSNPNGLYNGSMGSTVRGGISFVSANAAGSKYVVKPNMGNKPVNYVNWFDAARFANWMNNGQGGAGSTETGAYTMATANPVRLAGATVFLPSENEWYKAAYYDPANAGADGGGNADYWKYATMSDTVPDMASATSVGDVANPGPNVANYSCGAPWNEDPCNVTTGGSATSKSFYGAFDMGGNVWEWNESDTVTSRGLRGGAARFTPDFLESSARGIPAFGNYDDVIGFRVASLPAGPSDYTVTTSGGVIVVTDVSGSGDTLTLSEPTAGNIQFAAPGRTFSVNGGPILTDSSGPIPRTGVTAIVVNAGGGDDTLNLNAFTGTLPSLTLNGDNGDDTVTFIGDITFAANAGLDVDLQNDAPSPGVDKVIFEADANVLLAGNGVATVRCSRNARLYAGSSLEVENGELILEANWQSTPTPGNFRGIEISISGLVRSLGTGAVTVRGAGGNDLSGGQFGIWHDGSILGGTAGLLTVEAVGGVTTGSNNRGLQVRYGLISSSGAHVQVSGTGGGAGVATHDNDGVLLLTAEATISAGGSGSVTVRGTSGAGAGSAGVFVQGPGPGVTSGGGNVTIRGSGDPAITVGTNGVVSTPAQGGDITLIGDSIIFYDTSSVSTSDGGTVALRPLTTGRAIVLGSAGPNSLNVGDANLDRITTGTLQIGDASSGPITVNEPISPENYQTLAFGNDTTFSATGGFLAHFGPTFAVYDRMTVTGTLTIQAGAALDFARTGLFVPANGMTFFLISNDGTDAITGTFAGLPDGGTINSFLSSGLNARALYGFGGGNDLVVRVGNSPPIAPPQTFARAAGSPLSISIAALLAACGDPDPDTTLTLTSTGPTATGATVARTATELIYSPVNSEDDTFSYTIDDGSGGTATGIVSVLAPGEPFAPGTGPDVPGVSWAQRGIGTAWTGSGRTASFVGEWTGDLFDDTTAFNPAVPAPWQTLQATVEGPGVFSFQWSHPVQARGGREPDWAKCTLKVDDRVVASSPVISDRQQIVLGPGLHVLRWTPQYGDHPYHHMGGLPPNASFTLSDLAFMPSMTISEALDSTPGEWQPAGEWKPYYVESAAGQDAVWSEMPGQSDGFTATVTGPGTVVLDGLVMVARNNMAGWQESLRPVHDTVGPDGSFLGYEGFFKVTIDQAPSSDLKSGQVHRIPVGAGPHQISILAQKGWVIDSLQDGIYNIFRAQINSLQFVPEDSARFTISTVSRDAITGAFTLAWRSEPGVTYAIQQSTNFVAWTDLATTVPSGGTTTTATVAPPPGAPAVYYRIRRL